MRKSIMRLHDLFKVVRARLEYHRCLFKVKGCCNGLEFGCCVCVCVRLITPEGRDWNHAWTQFWDLPEGLLLNLVPMQNYSLTPTALTHYI